MSRGLRGVSPRTAARLGRSRAAAGRSVGSTLDDLMGMARGHRAGVSLAAVKALVEAWTAEVCRAPRPATCEDPLTGLASVAHLRTRLAEVYREAHRDEVAGPTGYTLVVVLWTDPDPAGTPLDRMLHRLLVAGALRRAFTGGETVAVVGSEVVVVLAARHAALPGAVRGLPGWLSGAAGASVHAWIEPLPGKLIDAHRLIADLAESFA